jgi:hypothetical protein
MEVFIKPVKMPKQAIQIDNGTILQSKIWNIYYKKVYLNLWSIKKYLQKNLVGTKSFPNFVARNLKTVFGEHSNNKKINSNIRKERRHADRINLYNNYSFYYHLLIIIDQHERIKS